MSNPQSPLLTPTRTPWQVTKSVWWALLVRETLNRTMADRLGWFWLFAQPVLITVVFVAIRAVLLGDLRVIAGAAVIPWLVVGLLAFQLFRETMIRSMVAVEVSRPLYSYRQVKAIDPVLIRCFIEGQLNTFILLIFIFSSLLWDYSLVPSNAVGALIGWMAVWFMGVGVGLTISTLAVLIPETKKIVPVTIMPLFMISGIVFPLNYLSGDLLEYLLFNPLVHGIEFIRSYFFINYQPVKGVSVVYLSFWCLGLLVLGLGLHLRYAQRLKVL